MENEFETVSPISPSQSLAQSNKSESLLLAEICNLWLDVCVCCCLVKENQKASISVFK